jgi:hypothetical protein
VTLTSLTTDIPSAETNKSGGVSVWCSNLTSLSLRTRTPNGYDGLFKWLPKLVHYDGGIDPISISLLPLSLTSLHTTGLSANHVMEILDRLPSLTHLYVDRMGHSRKYTRDQRRHLLLHHPTLTSIGGDIWDIIPSLLPDLVGSAGLPHLKSIEAAWMSDGFTNAIMKVAPSLSQITYRLFSEDGEELKALSKMKSLTHLKLDIRSELMLPLLVPNVSHVLKDLVVTGPFDNDDRPFEIFEGLTQLTSLTFVSSRSALSQQ